MQSSKETIDRFAAAKGEIRPIAWLTETGVETTRIEDAVEARVTKELAGRGGLLTIRISLATLPELSLELPAATRPASAEAR